MDSELVIIFFDRLIFTTVLLDFNALHKDITNLFPN